MMVLIIRPRGDTDPRPFLSQRRYRLHHKETRHDAGRDDLRFAARMLRKSTVFTVVAALVISLGIGAVTTIFSVMAALGAPRVSRLVPIFSGAMRDNRVPAVSGKGSPSILSTREGPPGYSAGAQLPCLTQRRASCRLGERLQRPLLRLEEGREVCLEHQHIRDAT